MRSNHDNRISFLELLLGERYGLGEPCPYHAVATLEALPKLNPGEILEVLSDCPQSINNIPEDAKNHGYEVLSIEQFGASIRYLIRR